jgi:hypothetical protein
VTATSRIRVVAEVTTSTSIASSNLNRLWKMIAGRPTSMSAAAASAAKRSPSWTLGS